MKKVLITGSNGLLGQKLIDLYRPITDIQLIATSRGANRYPKSEGYIYAELDITNEKNVKDVLEQFRPDTVINTAAMTNVDACESDKEGCDALNVHAVEYLTESCNEIDAHFIHLSTDFIFDGEDGPYTEDDTPNPLSYYGLSKWKGEQIIMNKSRKWAIARTILVYGVVHNMSRGNIVLWAKGALEKGEPINVVNDQFRMPTLAEDLAMGCRLIENTEAEGVYNISGKDLMSIDELVSRIADFYKLDKSIIQTISSETLNQAAKRPPKTGFNLSKSIEKLGFNPHSFEEGLMIFSRQLEASF